MAASPLRPTTPTLAKYPIPVELITTLYRAGDAEFAALVAGMAEYARARVAAYCVERERLLDLGLRMAGTCGEATLVKAAGAKAGAALFAQSRPAPVPEAEPGPVSPEPVAVAPAPAEPAAPAESIAPTLRVLEFTPAAPAEAAQPAPLVGPARPKAA